MLRSRLTACAMAALLIGGSAAAQSPGTLLIGGFGQYTRYDSQWGLDTDFSNSIGYGGRVGAFIAPQWNLEADGSYTPANARKGTRFMGVCPCLGGGAVGGDVLASALTARLVYSFPAGNVPSFHIGAGGVLENFRGPADASPATYQFGVNGLAGFNIGLGGFALRVDGFANYLPSNGGRFDFGAQAGLQLTPDLSTLMGGTSMASSSYGPMIWWDELAAPLPGTVEIGPFVQYSWFDDNAGRRGAIPEDGIGYGGRVGVFLSNPRWELEGDGYYSPQKNSAPSTGAFAGNRPADVNAHAFAMRMLYNFPLGNMMGRESQFIIGAGATRTSYKFENGTLSPKEQYTYNYGATGDVGLRIGIANRTALRIDGIVDYMPNHKPDANLNFHVRAGLSLLLGGARPIAMCTVSGKENLTAADAGCFVPCQYNASIANTSSSCVAPVTMCSISGLGDIPASDARCVPPVAALCQYNSALSATDSNCVAPSLRPIYFDYDKSTIRSDAEATLQNNLGIINASPSMRIRIEGNADERGSDEYNIALGQRRAQSAKKWLVDHGVDAGRIDIVSYGEERPTCQDHDEACWQQNRRDDFVIVTGGPGMEE